MSYNIFMIKFFDWDVQVLQSRPSSYLKWGANWWLEMGKGGGGGGGECNTIQYNKLQYDKMRCDTIQYNTTQYGTIQYNT